MAPAEGVKDWPLVGDELYQSWSLASTNLVEAVDRLGPQVRPVAGVLQFVASVIIAGFLYVPAE